jgi:hypothetical protein
VNGAAAAASLAVALRAVVAVALVVAEVAAVVSTAVVAEVAEGVASSAFAVLSGCVFVVVVVGVPPSGSAGSAVLLENCDNMGIEGVGVSAGKHSALTSLVEDSDLVNRVLGLVFVGRSFLVWLDSFAGLVIDTSAGVR